MDNIRPMKELPHDGNLAHGAAAANDPRYAMTGANIGSAA